MLTLIEKNHILTYFNIITTLNQNRFDIAVSVCVFFILTPSFKKALIKLLHTINSSLKVVESPVRNF